MRQIDDYFVPGKRKAIDAVTSPNSEAVTKMTRTGKDTDAVSAPPLVQMIVMDLEIPALLLWIFIYWFTAIKYLVYAMLSLFLYQFHVKQIIFKKYIQINILSIIIQLISIEKKIKNALGLFSNSDKTKEMQKSKHICFVTTSKCAYLQENHVIIILLLTSYYLLFIIINKYHIFINTLIVIPHTT